MNATETSCWISMRGVVVKCSRERVRLATDEEWLGAELIKHLQDDMKAKLTRSGERGYLDIDDEPLPDENEPEPPDTNIQHGVPGNPHDDSSNALDEHFSPTGDADNAVTDDTANPESGRLYQIPEADSDTDVGEPENGEEAMETDDLPADNQSVVSTRAPTSVLARQTPVSSTVGLLPQRRELEDGEAPRGSRMRTTQTPASSSGNNGRPSIPPSAAPPGGWAAAEVRNRALNNPGAIPEGDYDSVDLLAKAYFNTGKESHYISKMDILPGTHPKMSKAQAHVFFQEEQKIP